MTYNDYVILVDENGTPYIAHGERYQRFKNNLKNSRAVKYLARFPNFYGMGKTAYAYTEQQLRNLRNGGRKAANTVKNTAKKAAKYVDDHDAGLTERIQANRLHRKAKKAERQGKSNTAAQLDREAGRLRAQSREEYDRSGVKKAGDTIRKYGSTSMNAIRGAGRAAAGAAGNAARKAGRFIDDHDAGLTEAVESRIARSKKNRAIKTGDTQGISAYSAQEARLREQSRKEFEESGLGKAANTAKNAGRNVATRAGNAISNSGKSVIKALGNAQDTVNGVIDRKITGSSASQNMSSAQRNALMGLDGAIGDYMDAQQAYESTLKGGSQSAIQRAQQALSEAKENVGDLFNSVSGFFTSKEKQAVQSALNYELDPVTGEWVTKGR